MSDASQPNRKGDPRQNRAARRAEAAAARADADAAARPDDASAAATGRPGHAAGREPAGHRDAGSARTATSPTGTTRRGRREHDRRRAPEQTTLQRLRTPILAIVAIVALAGVGFAVVQSAVTPVYACSTIDTVKPAASGELGQVQPDQGNQHVQPGDRVSYPLCPPASGKHINKTGFGPLEPKVYGPDDDSVPNGWIHNLEHGGLVLLYSCDKGACDAGSLDALKQLDTGFPTSAVCKLAPGLVGPVVARFEQMPTKYAALVWNRVLYLDTLDTAQVYDFFSRYAERVSDGRFVAPPEPQCGLPSAEPSAAPSPEASAGASATPTPAAS